MTQKYSALVYLASIFFSLWFKANKIVISSPFLYRDSLPSSFSSYHMYCAMEFLFFGHRINGSCWFHLVSLSHPTVADKIVGLKSIAAYRSGLGINTNVTRNEAQEGLAEVLKGEDHDLRWISILLLYSPQIFSNLVCFYSWQSCSYHR